MHAISRTHMKTERERDREKSLCLVIRQYQFRIEYNMNGYFDLSGFAFISNGKRRRWKCNEICMCLCMCCYCFVKNVSILYLPHATLQFQLHVQYLNAAYSSIIHWTEKVITLLRRIKREYTPLPLICFYFSSIASAYCCCCFHSVWHFHSRPLGRIYYSMMYWIIAWWNDDRAIFCPHFFFHIANVWCISIRFCKRAKEI